MRLVALVLVPVLVGACAPDEEPFVDTDLLSHLPKHEEQRAVLCARGRDDAVTAAFCGDTAPSVTSLADLQALLGLAFPAADSNEVPPAFSLVAHSSALPARSVSSMNPGSVIVSLPPSDLPLNGTTGPRRTDGNVVSMAYARGDDVVELAVTPANAAPGDITFYLLRNERPCHESGACTFDQLLTEETERGWSSWSLYDDGDLENSVFDCLHCHQPEGPGTRRIHRMQELENPWTHWVAPFTLSGRVLLDDIELANPDEDTVAGIPRAHLFRTDPVVVEDLVRFSASDQPNEFPAPAIEDEVMASNAAQPRDNSTPGTSASWDVVYDCAVRGDAIPPPYHDVKVTDADKLASMADAFARFRAGTLDTLPDVREVFAEHALAGMSHRPKPGLDGRGILVHACAQCHNGRLNPDLSRAQFDATNIDATPRDVRERAIERLRLPKHDRYLMPPHLFRDLSDDEIALVVEALRG